MIFLTKITLIIIFGRNKTGVMGKKKSSAKKKNLQKATNPATAQ